MKSLVTLFCMVFALVSVESLTCKSCLNRNGDSCNDEDTVECGDVEGCSTVSGFIRYGSTVTQFIRKGCPYKVPCGEWLCLTSDEVDWQSYINCCEGKDCNPDFYIPVDNEKENGYVCPYCYEDHNTEGCTSETTVKCRGNDTLCVEYRGVYFKPDGSAPGSSYKMCANEYGFKNVDAFCGIEEIERHLFQIIEPIKSPDK
ncbi:phospholipase A2 inhibitor and Ly6/PLAUR domain-containing protein-like [Anomaloglossus baeobatrachus]|uniref:phospholipase A2 inhibitor and Ly6/PLAUR domain-containing protein-like n=1 Tax=Anomaloglossus baeobatrachus TaxID=238106 RepID=UPI003F507201